MVAFQFGMTHGKELLALAMAKMDALKNQQQPAPAESTTKPKSKDASKSD